MVQDLFNKHTHTPASWGLCMIHSKYNSPPPKSHLSQVNVCGDTHIHLLCVLAEGEEEEDLFVFNDTIEGPGFKPLVSYPGLSKPRSVMIDTETPRGVRTDAMSQLERLRAPRRRRRHHRCAPRSRRAVQHRPAGELASDLGVLCARPTTPMGESMVCTTQHPRPLGRPSLLHTLPPRPPFARQEQPRYHSV
jgi:hypothetical protein